MADKDTEEYIYSVADATAELTDAMSSYREELIKNINSSKTWSIVSRMTSGSDFWKVQNKFRALTTAMVLYNDTQKKSIKRSQEMGKALTNYAKIAKKVPSMEDWLSGGKKTKKIKKSKEYKAMHEMQQEIHGAGSDEAKKATDKYFADQIAAQNEIKETMKKRMIREEQYNKMNPVHRFFAKMKDKLAFAMKFLGAFLKAALGMFLKFTLWFLLLMPIIAVVVKIFKELNERFDIVGKTIWLIKGIFKALMAYLTFMFKVASAAFKGDLPKIFKLLFEPWLMPIVDGIKWIGAKIVSIAKFILGIYKFFYIDLPILIVKKVVGFGKNMVKAILKIPKRIKHMIQLLPRLLIAALKSKLSFLSTGGPASGLTVVGEKGPELLNLPAGARVHSNGESRSMGGNTINVHVNGRVGASDAEIRDIAQKVAREINLQMSRTSNTVGRF